MSDALNADIIHDLVADHYQPIMEEILSGEGSVDWEDVCERLPSIHGNVVSGINSFFRQFMADQCREGSRRDRRSACARAERTQKVLIALAARASQKFQRLCAKEMASPTDGDASRLFEKVFLDLGT